MDAAGEPYALGRQYSERMGYDRDLARLEHLLSLVEKWMPVMYESGPVHDQLHREICEVYGETSHVFDKVVGRGSISVPNDGSELDPIWWTV